MACRRGWRGLGLGVPRDMAEMQQVLQRIAALRERLEKDPDLPSVPPRLGALLRQIADGDDCDARLQGAVRSLVADSGEDGAPVRPLSNRARRVLEKGRELLGRLRGMVDVFVPVDDQPTLVAHDHPLARSYRATTSATDTALRLVLLLPDLASAQLRLSEGLEITLADVSRRVALLEAAVSERKGEEDRIHRLAGLLAALGSDDQPPLRAFQELAEQELNDLHQGKVLRFATGDPKNPARFAACHGLTTARVLARVARQDLGLRGRLQELILAG